MRFVFALIVLMLPAIAPAAERTSHFADGAAYASFVDDTLMHRRFADLVQRLGGDDEYTPEEMDSIAAQLAELFPSDFTNSAVLRETDLGGGFRQEARAYWSQPDGNYLYYYALLHDREDGTVVLTFSANTDIDVIMELF